MADGPLIVFCMLNPSTADENANDPTVERCERRARMMGFSRLRVVNLFAFRSTNPLELYTAEDPIGLGNDDAIVRARSEADMMVCGWGRHGAFLERGKRVLKMLRAQGGRELQVLGLNADHSPKHPLYVSYSIKPVPLVDWRAWI